MKPTLWTAQRGFPKLRGAQVRVRHERIALKRHHAIDALEDGISWHARVPCRLKLKVQPRSRVRDRCKHGLNVLQRWHVEAHNGRLARPRETVGVLDAVCRIATSDDAPLPSGAADLAEGARAAARLEQPPERARGGAVPDGLDGRRHGHVREQQSRAVGFVPIRMIGVECGMHMQRGPAQLPEPDVGGMHRQRS